MIWTPAELADLQLWYDADAIIGLSDNDPVATWEDQSANGYDATAAGAARPTYKTSIQNGLPIVRGDGSNNVMDTGEKTFGSTTLFADATQAFGIYIVAMLPSASAGGYYMARAGLGGNSSVILALRSDPQPTSISPGHIVRGNLSGTNRDINDDTFRILEHTWDGTTFNFRYDGGTPTTVPVGAAVDSPLTLVLFALSTGATASIACDFGEIVIVDADLSTDDRQKVEGYLAWKWGLENNLPVGHPYKSAAPSIGTEYNESVTYVLNLNNTVDYQRIRDCGIITPQKVTIQSNGEMIILPSPQFGDQKDFIQDIILHNFRGNSQQSYVKGNNNKRQLVFNFANIGRGRLVSLEYFFRKYIASDLIIKDHNGNIWRGRYSSGPFNFTMNNRFAPSNDGIGEGGSFTLTFEVTE